MRSALRIRAKPGSRVRARHQHVAQQSVPRSYNIWGKHERPSLPGKLLNRRGEQIAASISWVAYSQYLAGAGEAQSRPVSCPDTEFDSIDAGCS
jgi:hypothetical protein